MKKKIAILGSTGSIGKTLLSILKKNKAEFDIKLISCNTNYNLALKQAKFYNVKNLIISNKISFHKALKLNRNKKINIYNNFDCYKKIFTKKLDYSMCAISGIPGLIPINNIIKYSKNIAIANKESLICGWKIIKQNLLKNKTKFIPIDSEHFSIWKSLKGFNLNSINKIILTASGGPFLNTSKNKMKKIKITDALKHPNWRMGKKISIDSATMMNKVFEIIEARNIFGLKYDNLEILIHPKSYIHAIVIFNNGLIKLVAHETTMEIPIFNSLFPKDDKAYNVKNINLKTLNDLNLQYPKIKKYPSLKLLKFLPKQHTLFDTVLVSANDELVKLFLKNKISFSSITKILYNFIFLKEFNKYKKQKYYNLHDISKLDEYVRLKINSNSI